MPKVSNAASESTEVKEHKSPEKKGRFEESTFVPPSPSGRFSLMTVNKQRSYPLLVVSYDEIARLAFLEVLPSSSKKTQYLGALALPPNLEVQKKEETVKTLTGLGIFTVVPKVNNSCLIREEKISKNGVPYEVFQWIFVSSIETDDVRNHLIQLASKFISVSFIFYNYVIVHFKHNTKILMLHFERSSITKASR